MDDFPAVAASPGPRRPRLSVVIPVRDGGADFERCLRGLRASDRTDYELVVVDDGSKDDSAALAERFGAVVLRHDRPLGPAAARNAGASAATTPFVFFLDADVIVHPDTLDRAVAHLDDDPHLDALFGSYDDRPTAPGVVSRFRNLLHHFVHQQGTFDRDRRPAHTFWTGCGLIRRQAFLHVGGFDPERYRRPAIEDIELGYRLTRAGSRIALARDVQVTHQKRWTLRSMVRTDIFCRGVPWMLLLMRTRMGETDLNVDPAQRACVAATGVGLIGLAAIPLAPRLGGLLLFLNLAAILGLNRRFYRFLADRRGVGFALASLPLHHLYYLCCGASVAIAAVLHHTTPRPAVAERPRTARFDAPSAPVPRGTRTPRRTRWTRHQP